MRMLGRSGSSAICRFVGVAALMSATALCQGSAAQTATRTRIFRGEEKLAQDVVKLRKVPPAK